MLILTTLTASAWGQTLELTSIGMGIGTGRHRSQEWSLASVSVANHTSEPADVMVVASFKNHSDIQFGRRVWLPSLSRRNDMWLPLKTPLVTGTDRTIDVDGMLVVSAPGRSEVAPSRQPMLAAIETRKIATAIVVSTDGEDAINTALAQRVAAGEDQTMSYLRAVTLPTLDIGYRNIDALILAHRELHLNPAQQTALRNWLLAGGKLWVMLDMVPPQLMTGLLGEDWPVQEVDRVQLSSISIQGNQSSPNIDYEIPLPMVRVLAPRTRVMHQVQEWPASFRLQVGRGTVLVTTLDSRAWVHGEGKARQATAPLLELGHWLHDKTQRSPMSRMRWDNFLAEQLGYHVLDRRIIAGALGLYCLLLILAGVYLYRRAKLEHIGWFSLLLAAGFSAVMLFMGSALRSETPQTMLTSGSLEVVPGQASMVRTGSLAIYSPNDESQPLRGLDSGDFWPDLSQQSGAIVRAVFTDMNQWQWNSLNIHSGAVTRAKFNSVQPIQPPVATYTFGPQGVSGAVSGAGFDQLQDAILISPTMLPQPHQELSARMLPLRRAGVTWSAPGTFVSGADDLLGADQYLSGVMASDAQRRRRQMLTQLLDQPGFVKQPTILAWTDQTTMPYALSDQTVRKDQSLVSIPLAFRKPAPGTQVLIPQAFIPYMVASGMSVPSVGNPAANADRRSTGARRISLASYDPLTGRWMSVTQSTTLELEFHVPPQLRPLRLDSAVFHLDIRAPGRTVSVRWLDPGADQPLVKTSSPPSAISMPWKATDSKVMLNAPDDIVRVQVTVSEMDNPTDNPQFWQIREVGLQVNGVLSP